MGNVDDDISEVPEEYQASAFNGQDLETGSIFSKDESDEEDDEAQKWRKKFKRRVKVSCSNSCVARISRPRTSGASLRVVVIVTDVAWSHDRIDPVQLGDDC